jgi:hypothetical protein
MNFIQYERENSPLLEKLKENDFKPILNKILEKEMTVLVPMSKSIEFIKDLDLVFVQSHVLYINKSKKFL